MPLRAFAPCRARSGCRHWVSSFFAWPDKIIQKKFCNTNLSRIFAKANIRCGLQALFALAIWCEMTEEGDKLLNDIEARLRHLAYLREELKRENEGLKETLEAKERELEQMREEYEALQASYTNLRQARIIAARESEVGDTKQRLSKLVREVDKCIALLNE